MPDNNEVTRTETEVALEAGRMLNGVSQEYRNDDMPEVIILNEHLKVHDLEQYQSVPRLVRQQVELRNTDSFIEYVERFKLRSTVLFANYEGLFISAVIDYHGASDEPSWCTHKARLLLKSSPEWARWIGNSGKSISQETFADFLEDNSIDIISPDAATILEAATHLEEAKEVTFKSGINLSNGSLQLNYTEEVGGKQRENALTIPKVFTLRLRPFHLGDYVEITARLRYRIKEAQLYFIYILDRPERVIEEAFKAVIDRVEAETQLVPFNGSAL